MRFLEAFLMFCALRDSDPISAQDQSDIDHNQQAVATRGREPGLVLKRRGKDVTLREWAENIFDALAGICELLDASESGSAYTSALALQREGVADPEHLPSARMLEEMDAANESYFQYAMRLSHEHQDFFASARLSDERREDFEAESSRSLAAQRDIEASDELSFPEYLDKYFSQSISDVKKTTA